MRAVHSAPMAIIDIAILNCWFGILTVKCSIVVFSFGAHISDRYAVYKIIIALEGITKIKSSAFPVSFNDRIIRLMSTQIGHNSKMFFISIPHQICVISSCINTLCEKKGISIRCSVDSTLDRFIDSTSDNHARVI